MVVDFQGEFKKKLRQNVSLVRTQIDNSDFVYKIEQHADRFGRTPEEVREKIMADDMYAETFAKDPAKQNIYEKLAAAYISALPFVVGFQNLPNSAKIFVSEGVITSERKNDQKSIDFQFQVGNSNVYVSHKYIKALNGGAQDNQYNDIRNFLRNCNRVSGGNDYFLAICDGPYFADKLATMNEEFGSPNVAAMTIEDLEGFLLSIK